MYDRTTFGEDQLDINDLLEREETILEATDAPDDDDWEFLKGVKELRDQFYGSSFDEAAQNEPALVLEDYKAEYAENYASEVTNIDTSEWPLTSIDWEAAADDLFGFDWTEYTIGEYTYLGRNF